MKKSIILLLTVVLCLSLCACGTSVESITLTESEIALKVEETVTLSYELVPADIENPKLTWSSSNEDVAIVDNAGVITAMSEGTAEITVSAGKDVTATCAVTVGKKEVTETANMKLQGIYVDESYKDEDSESLRMVFLVYDVTPESNNIKLSTFSTTMTFDGKNSYSSKHFPDMCKYMGNSYYSNYLKDVYVGDTLKVVETFEIPVSELEKGKEITFEHSKIADSSELVYLTDNITFCKNIYKLSKLADPEGYAKEQEKRKDADSATQAKVKELLNGYYWSFYVNSTSYEIEFYAPNNFELRTIYKTANGKYTIKNGYINCTYPDTGYTIEIPYELKDGDIDLETADAFDVNT